MSDTPSQAYHLLELIALCGELPAAAICRLPMTKSYRYKVVAGLKNKKLIRLYERDGVKAYRLTAAAKELLMQQSPSRFHTYLDGSAEQNLYRSELTRRLRLHANAQTYVTMRNAGIPLFRDEKAPLFEASPRAAVSQPDAAVFYCSREFKDIGNESKKIRSSRASGILFDDKRIYLTYNTGGTIMKWEHQTEMRLRSLIDARFCHNPERSWYSGDDIIGLMLGDSMETALQLLRSGGGYRNSGFRPDAAFERFWFCPNSPAGEAQLRILTSSSIYAQIRQLLLSDLMPKSEESSIEHDAWEPSGRPILLALDFDMPRLRRFRDALELFGRTGQLFCFDFQVPVLREYMDGLVDVRSVSLDKIRRRYLTVT